ncbi:MAG: PEGA domain-containing protein, partial [Myxococcota bacterium]
APEQARLQPVDSRTDVFSLGCVYYELLSGLTFYDGGDPVAMVARASSLTREDAFARVSDMGFSESVARVLRNMLSPDPGERYANARDLLEDLERVLIRSGKVERAKDVRELCLEFMEASVILHEDGLRNASPPGVMERDLQDKLDHALSSKTSSPPSNTQSSTLRRAAAAVALLSVVAIAVYSVYRPTEALDTAREAEIPDVTIGEITLLGSEPESQADSKPPELLAERIRRTAPEKAGKRKRRYERTGMVSLTSEQPMQVYWRGRRIGNTPLSDFRLPTGSQTLRIVNRGEFVDREIRVHVKAGESVSKSVTLTRGSLAIRADPWADVYINEQRVGTTPMPALRLVEGLYVLDFRNPATGKSEKKRIRVSSGREQVVRVNLN